MAACVVAAVPRHSGVAHEHVWCRFAQTTSSSSGSSTLDDLCDSFNDDIFNDDILNGDIHNVNNDSSNPSGPRESICMDECGGPTGCVGCGLADIPQLRYTVQRNLLNEDCKLSLCRGCWLRTHRCAGEISQRHRRCDTTPSEECRRFLDGLQSRLPRGVFLITRNYNGTAAAGVPQPQAQLAVPQSSSSSGTIVAPASASPAPVRDSSADRPTKRRRRTYDAHDQAPVAAVTVHPGLDGWPMSAVVPSTATYCVASAGAGAGAGAATSAAGAGAGSERAGGACASGARPEAGGGTGQVGRAHAGHQSLSQTTAVVSLPSDDAEPALPHAVAGAAGAVHEACGVDEVDDFTSLFDALGELDEDLHLDLDFGFGTVASELDLDAQLSSSECERASHEAVAASDDDAPNSFQTLLLLL